MSKFSELIRRSRQLKQEHLKKVKRWVELEELNPVYGTEAWWEKYHLSERLFKEVR